MFDWPIVIDSWSALLHGMGVTLTLSLAAFVLSGALSLLLGFARALPVRSVSLAAKGYVEVVRGVPLLVLMYFLYYGLPAFGIRLSAVVAAIAALSLTYSSYMAEVLRSALLSVEAGQSEAARALGLSYLATQRRIVMPQALRIALPALTGEFIDIVKWSSVASIVVVPEITQVVSTIVGRTFDGFGSFFLFLAAFYLCVSAVLTRVSRAIETSWARFGLKHSYA